MEKFYRIKVTIGRISFELESHDKAWLEKKEKDLGSLLSNPEEVKRLASESASGIQRVEPAATEASITINEFHRKYLSGTNLPRLSVAMFLIHFLERYRKLDGITTNDVKDAFKEIGYPKFNTFNFTDILNQGKKKGWLNKIDNRWKLTITGIDYVLNEISQE